MILAILKWIPKAVLTAIWLLINVILTPIVVLPCFVFKGNVKDVLGYHTDYPTDTREFIVPWLSWFTTFDAAADEHWYTGRTQKLSFFGWKPFENMTNEDFLKNGFVRYVSRWCWMWRNPGYGFAHFMGYDQAGVVDNVNHTDSVTRIRDQDYLWDKGYNNSSLYTCRNSRGQTGFMFDMQYFWFNSNWCLEVYLGYKIPWKNDPANRAMITIRIIPFKRYDRVVPKPTE